MRINFSYSLNLWGVSGQSCGQSTGAVFMIIKPANLLSQHGLETQTPQSTSQQLPRFRERIALRKRMINAANSEELTNTICTCFWTSLKILTHLQHLCEKRNHTNEHKEQTDAINFSPLLNRIGHRESLQVETQVKSLIQETRVKLRDVESRTYPYRQDLTEEKRIHRVHPSVHSCSDTSKQHVGPFREVIFQYTGHGCWLHLFCVITR